MPTKYRVAHDAGYTEFVSELLANEYSEQVNGTVESIEYSDTTTPQLRQSSRVVVLSRLTPAEFDGLKNSTDQIVRRFYDAALAEGELVSTDPDFGQAVAYLDHIGIIAASRWETILAK